MILFSINEPIFDGYCCVKNTIWILGIFWCSLSLFNEKSIILIKNRPSGTGCAPFSPWNRNTQSITQILTFPSKCFNVPASPKSEIYNEPIFIFQAAKIYLIWMKPKEHIFFKIKSNVNKLYNCETDNFPCISMWTDCLQKCGFALLVCDVRTTVHRMTKNLHRFSTFCRNGSLNSNASIKALNFAKTSSIKVFRIFLVSFKAASIF